MTTSTMTSRERVFTAITMSGLPDQLPVVPLLLTRGVREGGITCDVAQRDPEAMAASKLAALAKFGGDVVAAGTDLFTPVENIGAELDYLPHAQPSLVRHPAPTKEAFRRLRDDYERNGFNADLGRVANVAREIAIYVDNGLKDSHVVVAPVGGPITTAQLMTGSSEFLNAIADDPDYAHEVLDLALDVVKNVCRVYFEAGVDAINVLDPFASSDILPPEVFREFGLPPQRALYEYFGTIGGVGLTHICTYTQPIWKDVVGSGCVNFNGDMYPGADHAKRAIGGEISLMGSVSPFTTLLNGTPDDVAREVRKLAVEVGYNGGFICMPGCDIDWNVPDENLHALIDTCASITYPLDVREFDDLSDVYLPGHPRHRSTRANSTSDGVVEAPSAPTTPEDEVYARLVEAIMDYDGDKAVEWTQIGLERGLSAQQIVFDGLSVGMKVVGDMYERNERFVTDMLKAAKTMDRAMPILTPLLESSGSAGGPSGTVVMGLVRGNTQDIGKNLVCLMLKANGYRVVDLGKNVKPEQFLAAVREHQAVAVGMSVMTNSSTVYVERTIELLREEGLDDQVLIMTGGAAANRPLADRIGAEYGSDANAAVQLVRDWLTQAA